MLSAKEDKIQGFNGHEQLTTYLYGETNEVVIKVSLSKQRD